MGVNDATGTVQWDHAIGNNSTGNGGGTSISNSADNVAGYAALIAANNVAQNSWNMEFFNNSPWDTFNPNQVGTYDFYLAAFDGQTQVARTDIKIHVTPEPATMLLFGVGLLGIAGVSRRRKA